MNLFIGNIIVAVQQPSAGVQTVLEEHLVIRRYVISSNR